MSALSPKEATSDLGRFHALLRAHWTHQSWGGFETRQPFVWCSATGFKPVPRFMGDQAVVTPSKRRMREVIEAASM
jgi:hypothetical protein